MEYCVKKVNLCKVVCVRDYDGLSEKEIHYIDEARIIGRTEGNNKRLSDLYHKAYADYTTGAISEMAYNKIYAVCMICKPDTKAPHF